MKRSIMVLSFVLSISTACFGSDWESRLPAGTSDRVRAHLRDVIRAGVDPDRAVLLAQRMEGFPFAEAHKVRMCEIIAVAQKDGLPVDFIMNKAYEGMAKRIEAERIIQAMETVRSRYSLSYQQARSLTADERQQRALGQVIAEGLAAGIAESDLARIVDNLRQQARQIDREQMSMLSLQSFQVARDMARLGVLTGTLTDLVCTAVQMRFTARDMEQMRSSFMSEARYGNTNNLANQYGAQLRAGAGAAGVGSAGAGAGPGSAGRGGGSSGGGSGGSGGGSGGGRR